MKRNALLVVMVPIFVLLLTTPGYSWQGRMAGMGDVNGIIEDESDFLIHPAAIASGKGLNVYGNYRLTYDKATKWDYSANSPSFGGISYPYITSGYEWKNEGQLGTAFTLGAGRMGVFFEYTGITGKYTGNEIYTGIMSDGYYAYDLKNTLDNYAVRIIYGLPVGSIKLGGEIQIAYRNEEKENVFSAYTERNIYYAAEDYPTQNLFPYMIPFKSKYWEAQGKVSIDGAVSAVKYSATLKGGLPFASKNEYIYNYIDLGDGLNGFNAEGNVKGFNVGGDFLLRVPVSSNMALPFIVSAGYKQIKRDGSGISTWDRLISYEHEAKDFFVKVGGGLDYTPTQGFKIAAGLYYDFLNSKQSVAFSDIGGVSIYYYDTYSDMPKQSEHRLTFKAAAEKEFSSTFALRGGFNVFYGMVKSDYAYSAYDHFGSYYPLDISNSGSNLGVNASIGATVKIDKVSLEPFINGGYVKYKTSGDGTFGPEPASVEFDKTNWIVGGGLSVKF